MSGEKPCDKASSDGESTKLLGYKWYPEVDLFAPGFSRLNMNKKIRCAKKPKISPIVTLQDANKLLEEKTRIDVVAKIAEFFNHIRLWEPIKLQLKLKLTL